ncbi:MAG: bifunctional 2-C-methyl-D-erythritol 4-phosphate cytidylyltransferase/2-C-methyl-D-erythritol [Microbacteriaceae bacterium]|nr:bifunctional 2-C-methyl-D-erythritol 4-phosphate cytidylyltransferase/2-C-methyl-D-erythritol [Microbacteriaceae bacterium]
MNPPTVAIIVVAAGSGARLGGPEPKAFVTVNGVSILASALVTVFSLAEPAQVIVVAPAGKLDTADRIGRDAAGAASEYLSVVSGGATRQQSVAAGLAVLGDSVTTVLVHDAARSLTPSSLFDAVIAAVRDTGSGVVPGIAVADTIKQTDDAGTVLRTLDRSTLVAVQTPQGFPRAQLVDAYAAADREFTDDAAVFAAAGHPVTVVDGDRLAFKITTSWDLRRAESLTTNDTGIRTGVGMDVHAHDDAAPLWLGGLYWPDEPGLAGHSDGDALSHAVCDALLSAAGLGDVGDRFGTSDPRFAGAHGDVFINETIRLVKGAGYSVGNVAVQLIANRPKLAGRRSELERYLGGLVGAPVSVAATTSDGLGFTGRGDGIAVIATALLYRDR